jgi:general secretion pathway protein G
MARASGDIRPALSAARAPHGACAARAWRGFTLIEFLIALTLTGILAAIAVPSYQSFRQQVNVNQAERDIGAIHTVIESYITLHLQPPPDLATIGMDQLLDPWGQPYFYLSFTGLNGKGKMRKDKNLVPINTQYDLYSAGPDGQTRPPLTAAPSRDDVVMANDGNFIGVASDY